MSDFDLNSSHFAVLQLMLISTRLIQLLSIYSSSLQLYAEALSVSVRMFSSSLSILGLVLVMLLTIYFMFREVIFSTVSHPHFYCEEHVRLSYK